MAIEVHPTGSGSTGSERRRTKGSDFVFVASMRERGRSSVSVKVADFSAHGCRIDGAMVSSEGQQAWIRLPGLEPLSARIAWCEAYLAGIAFDQPLHPAVARRFIPAPTTEISVAGCAEASSVAVLDTDPLMSRREQIMQGIIVDDASPLKTRKKPTGSGILGSITRQTVRTADHRRDMRFKDFTRKNPVAFQVDGQDAQVHDISSRGLRASVQIAAEIGSKVTVEVEGFDPINARLVWQCDSDVGLSLPDDSFDLHAA